MNAGDDVAGNSRRVGVLELREAADEQMGREMRCTVQEKLVS